MSFALIRTFVEYKFAFIVQIARKITNMKYTAITEGLYNIYSDLFTILQCGFWGASEKFR